MTDKRKLTEQIKALRRMLEDIEKHSELLEQGAIRSEVKKRHNILDEMEKDNENRRNGDDKETKNKPL